jgi:hypothetical protein
MSVVLKKVNLKNGDTTTSWFKQIKRYFK